MSQCPFGTAVQCHCIAFTTLVLNVNITARRIVLANLNAHGIVRQRLSHLTKAHSFFVRRGHIPT